MQNFFSAIQGKFDAKYDGRYLGSILEQIAAVHVDFIDHFLKKAPTQDPWALKSVQDVTAEAVYLSNNSNKKDRRADLGIYLNSGDKAGTILIEIKMKDHFLPGQLEEYISWAKDRNEKEDRAIAVLTAFPIKSDETEMIKENSKFIKHIYLSDLMEALRPKAEQSELISLFIDYLYEEGHAMYQLQPKQSKNQGEGAVDEADYDAFLSFMALTFLPQKSGQGRVASAKKIARGPIIFSNIIQNWQLVSDRFEAMHLENKRRPTIRHFPEQATNHSNESTETLADDSILTERRKTRSNKIWGRYWLTSDIVLDGNSKLRLEWGQIIQIQREKENDSEVVQCGLFAYIRQGPTQIGGKIVWLKDGIKDQKLYSIEHFMNELLILMRKAKTQAMKNIPELENILKFD